MSELEESLLDSDEEEAPKQKRDNSTIQKMREEIKAEKAAKEEALARAAEYEQEFLNSSGLNEKQAAALKAMQYKPTREGIEAFRAEILGVEPPKAEEPKEAVEVQEGEEMEAEPPFQPTQGGTATNAAREIDSKQFLALLETDPVKADKLLREGRVKHAEFNPGGPAF